MSASRRRGIGVLWRDDRAASTSRATRLGPVFDALAAVGIAAEPVAFSDEKIGAAHEQLLALDGVLVWVDPLMGGINRVALDALLHEIASQGVWVSAHPDTILAMGTKEVLYRTRTLSWGTDTHMYATPSEFAEHFPARLAQSGPRVLKQNRGNGGTGVWKVTPVDRAATRDSVVRVQHAAPRDTATEDITLGAFMERCRPYFADSGRLIDQRFISGVQHGMIRAYVVQDEVVGFARQQPAAPAAGDDRTTQNVFGLPSTKALLQSSDPEYAGLKDRLERDWIPGLQGLVGIGHDDLPLLWDADFLVRSATDPNGETYVLCEINVSSVLPFPDEAPHRLARAVLSRYRERDGHRRKRGADE